MAFGGFFSLYSLGAKDIATRNSNLIRGLFPIFLKILFPEEIGANKTVNLVENAGGKIITFDYWGLYKLTKTEEENSASLEMQFLPQITANENVSIKTIQYHNSKRGLKLVTGAAGIEANMMLPLILLVTNT